MASTNPTSADDILMFGSYYQTIIAREQDMAHNLHDRKLLYPEEISFIREVAAYDNSTAAMAFQERLSLGIDYYYAVKHQITSVLRLWDAVLDEKRRYDALGRFNRSRNFMDSFQLCSYLIPQRVSIGFLGPYADIQVDTNFDSMATLMSQPAPYHTETSTIFDESEATAVDPAEYETRNGGPAFEEEHPELALSTTSSDDNFEQTGMEDEIISISSDGDSDIDSGYSDDEELFPLELEHVVVADRAGNENNWHSTQTDFRETQAYELSGLTQDSAAWERFLSRLSETEQPYQGGANRGGFTQQSPSSNGGAPQPPQFGVMKKRKFSAVRDGYEEEATSKRSKPAKAA